MLNTKSRKLHPLGNQSLYQSEGPAKVKKNNNKQSFTYSQFFLVALQLIADFQVYSKIHGFPSGNMRMQQIVLHNISGLISEQLQVSWPIVDCDCAAGKIRSANNKNMHFFFIAVNIYVLIQLKLGSSTYTYPDRISNSVDLPAPDGPIIAVNSPARNSPLNPFRIVFGSGKKKHQSEQVNHFSAVESNKYKFLISKIHLIYKL